MTDAKYSGFIAPAETDLAAQVAELREIVGRMTPGEWECQPTETELPDVGVCIVADNLGGLVGAALPWPTEIHSRDYSRVEANATGIVALRNTALPIIDALMAENERLREALSAHNQRAANGDEIGLADEMEQAAGTLEAFIAANDEAAPNGLLDCTDNDGEHYQSEWMEGMMLHAKFGADALRKWAGTIRAALAVQP